MCAHAHMHTLKYTHARPKTHLHIGELADFLRACYFDSPILIFCVFKQSLNVTFSETSSGPIAICPTLQFLHLIFISEDITVYIIFL